MNNVWQIQNTKNKLSEILTRALKKGPQLISDQGENIAVVISFTEYKRLRGSQGTLSEFFKASPLHSIDLTRENERS